MVKEDWIVVVAFFSMLIFLFLSLKTEVDRISIIIEKNSPTQEWADAKLRELSPCGEKK